MMNMLNTKYIIYHPELPPAINSYALSNAWFVPAYEFVNTPDDELAAIENLKPAQKAVIDKRFESELAGLTITPDSAASIEMAEYKPNKLTYKVKAASEQVAVFSEVYYENGWQAYIDGKAAPHFRADWILRAMRIPAGEHEVIFKFEPKGYHISRTVATASSGLLTLMLIGAVIFMLLPKKKEE